MNIDPREVQEALKKERERLDSLEQELKRDRLQLQLNTEALMRVLTMQGRIHPEGPGELTLETPIAALPETPKGAVRQTVDQLIPILGANGGDISSSRIVSYLLRLPVGERPSFNMQKNKANIGAYLREYAADGKLQLIEKGSGTRPSVYRVKLDEK